MALSIGGGAAEGLEKILADRFKEALEAQRIREFQQQMQLQQDRLKQDQTQFDQNLGFQREQHDETKLNNEHNRNAVAANLAMRGSEFSRDVANDEAAQNQRLFDNAMRGTELASQQNENEADRAFTAGENAKNRASNQAIANTRSAGSGGGRKMLSGDANRIVDYQSALDDIDAIETALQGTEGATGAMAQFGAMVPNAVTEWTGIGEDAKQRQATIDRVKQVIGKSLEGGVLRKEDEAKYTKILPTIGDTPAVVSSKLSGLRDALRLRLERQIEGLQSAGYDTSGFQSNGLPRGEGRQPAPSDESVSGVVRRWNPETGRVE